MTSAILKLVQPTLQTKRTGSASLRSFAGFLAALLAFNIAAGRFVTPQRWVYPPLPVSKDLPDNPFREYREFTEGIASARINDSGARYTGEWLPGAPTIVLLGDSHVLARYVSDGEPMGAVIAGLSRQSGHLLNVRELGRSGGTPADFALASRAVLDRWHPERVVVVLSQRAFGLSLLHSAEGAIDPDGTVRAILPHDSTAKRLYWRFRGSSPLAELFCNNPVALFQMLRNGGTTGTAQPDAGESPAAGLADAAPDRDLRLALTTLLHHYGDRLVIAYHPLIGLSGEEEADVNERSLLSIAGELSIPCFSVRRELLAERNQRLQVPNGFLNRLPGEGHLNATGHRVVGTAIWNYLRTHGDGGSVDRR